MLIERVTHPLSADVVVGLAEILCESVDSGFSVGFLRGLTIETAESWWHELLAEPALLTWVARDGDQVVGTVSLHLDALDTGRHRAEITKLLVRQSARRAGVATALMAAAEDEAGRRGRTMLLLDTEAGSGAEPFYDSLGWKGYGLLADHAADPDGRLTPTVFFFKRLPTS